MRIFVFFLAILFCLVLRPKENSGCLILCALLAFISLAPNFLGASSTVVLATSLFILGLLVCAVNIFEATRQRTAPPFIGGILLFLGVVSFPDARFLGTPFFYYAKKYVYLYVLFDITISGFILYVVFSAYRFVCDCPRRLLRLNVSNRSRRETPTSENQESVKKMGNERNERA